MNKILITTPIFYVNAKPHIGTGLTAVLGCFLKRYMTLRGNSVVLTTGTDEHGDKVGKTAEKLGITPQQFCDKQSAEFQKVFDALDVKYDIFVRTTSNEHKQNVSSAWTALQQQGHIYEGEYTGYYCESEEAYYELKDLKDINGTLYNTNGKPVHFLRTPCHYLRISALKEQLTKILTNKNITYPERHAAEPLAFMREELKDLCISRRETVWGIPVPNDSQGRTIYVWFDALLNYLTVSHYSSTFHDYWLDAKVIHLVGKDILTFHSLFWPALLIRMNLLPTDFTVMVHNWWLCKQEKMSKSIGNVIDPINLIQKYGVSCIRFYIIFKNLLTKDADFDEAEMINLFNTYMVHKFSNLVHRIHSILIKNHLEWSKIPTTRNDLVESQMKECDDRDINEVLRILMDWCDNLNARVDNEKSWQNSASAISIASEIKAIVPYFTCICPEIESRFQNHLFPIFKPLQFVD